jgi:hypothetical protein
VQSAGPAGLLSERPIEAGALLGLLRAKFGDVGVEPGSIEMTPKRESELRSLGYIE